MLAFSANSGESYKAYDICVITAANEHQAQGYREQLERRRDRGSLPEETEFLVFADPQGKRIGSGGSTIYVLYKLLERFCHKGGNAEKFVYEYFKGKRILIIHSGGDSRRLPAYSAVGKIFIPLPTSFSTDGFAALFDLLFNNLMQLPCLSVGQVVVASGDVLLSFDTSKVAFSDSGVTGLAYPGPVEVASSHGVYIVPQTQPGENLRRVVNFLQKPTYDELEKCNGLDAASRAFIDTGVMNFGLDAIKVLMEASGLSLEDRKVLVRKGSLCESLINAQVQLDIYEEIPFAMLGKCESIDPSIHRLIDLLQQIPFFVSLLPYCEFFHVGTSKQLLQNLHTTNYTASAYDFQNFSKSKAIDKSGLGNAFVYNSLINTTSVSVNGPCLIEGCYLEGEIQLGGENILTGIPKGVGDVELREGICVACVPVSKENGWVSIIYGIEDDFRKSAEDDAATFLNSAFLSWVEDKGIIPTDLWKDNEPHDLWNARLFPFSTNIEESMRISLSLQVKHAASLFYQEEENFQLDRWRESSRMSLREILESVDYEKFLNNCSSLCQKVNLQDVAAILTPRSDLSSREILSWCRELGDYTKAARMTLDSIERSDGLLFQARLYKLLSNILRQADDAGYSIESSIQNLASSVEYEDRAFELVREAIQQGIESESPIETPVHSPTELRIQIRSDEVVWVCAPARLDFAGGWSDTPPYCLEHGGSVLNAAVKLNGQYPIQAIGKLHPEPFIRINSIDLGERIIVTETSQILSYQDPSDWSALPKAAFVAAGIIPEDKEFDLQDILRQLGSGIDLTLFSAVPSGSGLGTSSILGSAIIACLSRMIGQELTQEAHVGK